MTGHEHFEAMIADYTSGRLVEADADSFEAHLLTCESCLEEVARERALWSGLTSRPETLRRHLDTTTSLDVKDEHRSLRQLISDLLSLASTEILLLGAPAGARDAGSTTHIRLPATTHDLVARLWIPSQDPAIRWEARARLYQGGAPPVDVLDVHDLDTVWEQDEELFLEVPLRWTTPGPGKIEIELTERYRTVDVDRPKSSRIFMITLSSESSS